MPAPRGEARRTHILEAAIRLAGELGPAALTHRAVARAAGVPLAATTYWFASKGELLAEAYALASSREVERIRAATAQTEEFTGDDVAARLAAVTARELHGERTSLLASYGLWLEAARNPALHATSAAWTDAYVELVEGLLAKAGSAQPGLDARLVVAALDGLLLEQLSRDEPDFEDAVLRPALERLIGSLLAA